MRILRLLQSCIKNSLGFQSSTCTNVLDDHYEAYACYAEVFRRELGNIKGLTSAEKGDLFTFVSQLEDGFLNLGAHQLEIYTKYFKDKQWDWIEYTVWNDKFSKLGRFPTTFKPKRGRITSNQALQLLTHTELKLLLKSYNKNCCPISLKRHLVEIANSITLLDDDQIIQAKINEEIEREFQDIFTIFILTIRLRSKHLYEHHKALSVGIRKFETLYVYEEDREFTRLAIERNPKAVPPYYPCDLSILRPVVDI